MPALPRLAHRSPKPSSPPAARVPARRRVPYAAAVAALTALALGGDAAPAAASAGPIVGAAAKLESLGTILDNIRGWLMGLLVAWALVWATVAIFRYTSGDPEEVAKGKTAFRNAFIGVVLAGLAPVIMNVVAGWVQ